MNKELYETLKKLKFHYFIPNNRSSVNFNLQFYFQALLKEDIHALEIFCKYDNRKKEVIKNDLFHLLNIKEDNGISKEKKQLFIELLKNDIHIPIIDEKFMYNLKNIEISKII